jgi:hypothetical protein
LGFDGSLCVAIATAARIAMETQMPATTMAVVLIEDMPFIIHTPMKVYRAIAWTI